MTHLDKSKRPPAGCRVLVWLLVLSTGLGSARAQLSLTGQLRTRTEFRDGVGTLLPLGAKPAAFTSQRTGLTFGYQMDRLRFGLTVRDVRVWGQDASSISNADGSRLFLHEAWAELLLANRADSSFRFRAFEQLSLKIGRQELNYDDVRLLGNLDWLQQGRRFDMALLKAVKAGWQIDLGAAFNQNTDAFGVRGTAYTPGNVAAAVANSAGDFIPLPPGFVPTSGRGGAPLFLNAPGTNGQNQQYKSFQMLYLSRRFGPTKFSALLFKDDFQRYRIDSIGSLATGVVYGRRYDVTGTHRRITYGAMLTGVIGQKNANRLNWQVFGYGQGGKNRDGQALSAYHVGGHVSLQRGPFSAGPGYEVLSGTNTVSPDGKDHRFDPLYGTPHRHWGYLDFFYVGTGSPVGGLSNAFFKSKYVVNPVFFLTADLHHFALAAPTRNGLDRNGGRLPNPLGTELDVLLNYAMNKVVNVELGYSHLTATNSLEFVKAGTMGKTRHNANWAYLMLNIKPDFLAKK